MRTMRLRDPDGGTWAIEIPTTPRERVRGLLGRESLPVHHAMLLEHARSIHTFGMRFAIDAVLLDADLRVVAVKRLRPGRLLLPRPGVRHVLETPAGTHLRPGDRLAPGDPAGGAPRVRLRAARGRGRATPP